MTRHGGNTPARLALLCALVTAAQPALAQAKANTAEAVEANVAMSQALPALDGAHVVVKIVEVTYAPGGFSQAHSHPCAVIGYMLQGRMRMQVKGGKEMTYKAGDTFYEPANGVHAVSANASTTEQARFTATFICDRDVPLTVPPPPGSAAGPQG